MTLRLAVDSHGRLSLTTPSGEIVVDVVPVRCFPLGEPDRWISFLDAQGRERWLLEDPSTLDGETRALLTSELARREFIPRILRIRDIRPRSDPSTWEVDTDRGAATFVLPGDDSVRRLGPDAALVTDASGGRWHLSDISELDARSRLLLRRYW